MEILVLLVVLAVVVVAVVGYVAVARRDRHTDLEPPPAAGPEVDRSPTPPSATITGGPTDRATGRPAARPPTPEREPVEPEAPFEGDAAGRQGLGPETPAEAAPEEAEPAETAEPVPAARPRLRDRLGRARSTLAGALSSVLARQRLDDETWDELEEALIRADVGVQTTVTLLEHVRQVCSDEGVTAPDDALGVLKRELKDRLHDVDDRDLAMVADGPSVWLFVGVNGVGKTTTIGKLGKRETDAGHQVVLAAGDTFRAAAVEQLGTWAERSGAGFVHGDEGADPAAIIFDAVESAAARDADLVLADTAGRLHTKVNLMEELRKVRRVAEKGAGTVCEVLLVLDATTGQNGLVQARQFTEAVDVTGVVLTKLDGSAKGGIVLAIQTELGIPVKLVGLGEGVEDLVTFDPDEFVEALFDEGEPIR